MKNFLNKQRESMVLFGYASTVGVLIYFVILPLLAGIENINDQIQQEEMNQESVKLHIDELPKIQNQYQVLQDGVDLNNVLLDKGKAVVLIEKLEKMAESSNNKITISAQDGSVTVKKTTVAASPVANTLLGSLPDSNYLQIKITLNGEYDSIMKFIGLLENFEYYGDLTAIQINGDKAPLSSQINANSKVFSNNLMAETPAKIGIGSLNNDSLVASLDAVFYVR